MSEVVPSPKTCSAPVAVASWGTRTRSPRRISSSAITPPESLVGSGGVVVRTWSSTPIRSVASRAVPRRSPA
ncbi:hypothetical protein ACQPYE_30825 [Actinosynnema sp. CA-299493]